MHYCAIVQNDDYISHHGVKGMRWGHRKQPETAVATTSTEKKSRISNETKTKIKQYAKKGAKLALAALAVYGAVRVTQRIYKYMLPSNTRASRVTKAPTAFDKAKEKGKSILSKIFNSEAMRPYERRSSGTINNFMSIPGPYGYSVKYNRRI